MDTYRIHEHNTAANRPPRTATAVDKEIEVTGFEARVNRLFSLVLESGDQCNALSKSVSRLSGLGVPRSGEASDRPPPGNVLSKLDVALDTLEAVLRENAEHLKLLETL
jgi:hypothetical protein